MNVENWLVFASLITLASLSPGPNVLLVVMTTLRSGFRGAVFTILGNLMALFTIALAAALGVGLLLQTAPAAYAVMKVAGGLYLAWMGIKLLRASFREQDALPIDADSVVQGQPCSRANTMLSAMLVSWSNPKSILFLSAVFPAFLDTNASVPLQFVIMFATIIGIVGTIHGVYAVLVARFRKRLAGQTSRRWLARVSGGSFLGFGVLLVADARQ
ncbi:MAG: lysine transporter LysE [Gammaproteobacteria bacterium]|nr:MAG: lysine transporter LysE [Gammaproteobacteria bacterium]